MQRVHREARAGIRGPAASEMPKSAWPCRRAESSRTRRRLWVETAAALITREGRAELFKRRMQRLHAHTQETSFLTKRPRLGACPRKRENFDSKLKEENLSAATPPNQLDG